MKYEFVNSEDYFLTLQARFRKQHKVFRYWTVIGSILMILVAVEIAFSIRARDWPDVLFFSFLLLIFSLSSIMRPYFLRRRMRRSPMFNCQCTVQLSETGIHSNATLAETTAAWPAVTGARSFEDGLLLLFGPNLARWLPDAGLTSGTPKEARALVHSHVADFADVGSQGISKS